MCDERRGFILLFSNSSGKGLGHGFLAAEIIQAYSSLSDNLSMQIQFLKNGTSSKKIFFLAQTGVSGVAVPIKDLKRNFHATSFQEKQYIWVIQYAF